MSVLLEARSYRPFKSSEEYLIAMKEDLAEWLNALYPELRINVDNFMDRLDTGVALCKVSGRRTIYIFLGSINWRKKSTTDLDRILPKIENRFEHSSNFNGKYFSFHDAYFAGMLLRSLLYYIILAHLLL